MEMCGPELHTSRVAAQVERPQRPAANAPPHWAEGLAGERAPGPRAPSLAVPLPGALIFALPLVDVELSESGLRTGSCWLFQNLTSWPSVGTVIL